MVCLRNICINTLHKGDNDDNNKGKMRCLQMKGISQLLLYAFVVWTKTTLPPLPDKKELEALHNEAFHNFYRVKVEPVPFN
jgi:hypothetical protein